VLSTALISTQGRRLDYFSPFPAAAAEVSADQSRSNPGSVPGNPCLRRKSWDRDAIAFRAPPGGRSAIAMRDGAPAARGGLQLSKVLPRARNPSVSMSRLMPAKSSMRLRRGVVVPLS
jgi:hypothetical protein